MKKLPVVVAITGASGVMYGIRLVEALAAAKREIFLMVTDPARKVMETETDWTHEEIHSPKFLDHVFGASVKKWITFFDYRDVSTLPASGSFRTAGMIIAPCSGATLSAAASGASRDLVERAAEVTMKEGRRLVLITRETPLSAVCLENMLKLARLGVHMLPASPAFYQRPKTIEDLWDFIVGRALDLLDIEHKLIKRWDKKK